MPDGVCAGGDCEACELQREDAKITTSIMEVIDMDERKEFHPVKLELDESAKRMIFAAKMVRIITTPVAFPIACIIGVYKWTWKTIGSIW